MQSSQGLGRTGSILFSSLVLMIISSQFLNKVFYSCSIRHYQLIPVLQAAKHRKDGIRKLTTKKITTMGSQSTLRNVEKMEQESRKKIEQIWPPSIPFVRKSKHGKKKKSSTADDSSDDDSDSRTRSFKVYLVLMIISSQFLNKVFYSCSIRQ